MLDERETGTATTDALSSWFADGCGESGDFSSIDTDDSDMSAAELSDWEAFFSTPIDCTDEAIAAQRARFAKPLPVFNHAHHVAGPNGCGGCAKSRYAANCALVGVVPR